MGEEPAKALDDLQIRVVEVLRQEVCFLSVNLTLLIDYIADVCGRFIPKAYFTLELEGL
jgi:hypothetical protein